MQEDASNKRVRCAAHAWIWPIAMVLVGCSLAAEPLPLPQARELGHELPAFQAPADVRSTAAPAAPVQVGQAHLTLDDALRLALVHNPRLASFSWQVRAREAGALQASLLPNPKVTVELENFGGTGTASGLDQVEATVWFSQPIELGAKRRKRHSLAALRHELAGWDYESARLDVLTLTRQRYADALAAGRRLALAEETLAVARAMLSTVSRRVDAGRVSSAEASRAVVTLTSAQVERDRARRDRERLAARLAASWGDTSPAALELAGKPEPVRPLPPLEPLFAALAQTPELARWETEIAEREAAIGLRKADVVPTLTVSAGYRRLEETGDNALVFAGSVPLPLANRNEGAILEARYELARAEQDRRQARLRLQTALKEAYAKAAAAGDAAEALRNASLPAAEKAFEVISEGYSNGRFSYLEVLDAQRTLFATRTQLIDMVSEYEKERAALERLVAAPLDSQPAVPMRNAP